jgi:hypothetical protein
MKGRSFKDLVVEKTTHGYLLLGDYGEKEISFFSNKRDLRNFIKSEYGKAALKEVM